MRIVAIGDVGVLDGMMHIGDEAMFQAAADELRARGAEIIAVSSNPAETADRYGAESVGRIRFDGLDREAAEARLAAVWALAEGRDDLPDDDGARAVVRAVAGAHGVLIAGGGNLASTWPLHIYERVALAGIAARYDRPLVVSGQTLGPALRGRDRELVSGVLRSARLVRVRESASHRLAAELGAVARLGADDASFVAGPAASMAAADGVGRESAGVLVSLSLSLGGAPREETVERIARLVDAAADRVGGPVRFHAHFGSLDTAHTRGDAVLHDDVRARMRRASTVVPTGDVGTAASLARSAGLLITGRYHPAVFAAPAGVPVLGLTAGDYTAVKQRGALAHWGQDATVPLTSADSQGTPELARLTRDREQIAERARAVLPRHQDDARRWWDAVAAALT